MGLPRRCRPAQSRGDAPFGAPSLKQLRQCRHQASGATRARRRTLRALASPCSRERPRLTPVLLHQALVGAALVGHFVTVTRGRVKRLAAGSNGYESSSLDDDGGRPHDRNVHNEGRRLLFAGPPDCGLALVFHPVGSRIAASGPSAKDRRGHDQRNAGHQQQQQDDPPKTRIVEAAVELEPVLVPASTSGRPNR
jgi:hypothetical protein